MATGGGLVGTTDQQVSNIIDSEEKKVQIDKMKAGVASAQEWLANNQHDAISPTISGNTASDSTAGNSGTNSYGSGVNTDTLAGINAASVVHNKVVNVATANAPDPAPVDGGAYAALGDYAGMGTTTGLTNAPTAAPKEANSVSTGTTPTAPTTSNPFSADDKQANGYVYPTASPAPKPTVITGGSTDTPVALTQTNPVPYSADDKQANGYPIHTTITPPTPGGNTSGTPQQLAGSTGGSVVPAAISAPVNITTPHGALSDFTLPAATPNDTPNVGISINPAVDNVASKIPRFTNRGD